jgi:hypothetical protein
MDGSVTLYDANSFPEKPTATDEELEEFKQQVSEWVKLDEQVVKLNIAIRERRIHQRALSNKVQEFMIKFGYDNLNTTQGVIKSNVRNVKAPLKLSSIRSEIEKLGDATVSASELLKKLFDGEREVQIKRSLNRKIPKVSMNLEV